jgi:hypothetical protein
VLASIRVPVRYVLVYQDQRVPLPDGDIVVGRSMTCQIRFNAPTVSRQHLRLHVAADEVFAENLSSSTGTLLNGRRLTGRTQVMPGDLLVLGPRQVRLERAAPDARRSTHPQPALGPLPDDGDDDDEVTLTEDLEAFDARRRGPQQIAPISFHTCPRCRTHVPFERSTCPSCGHVWDDDQPSARLGQVTSRNVADEVAMPGSVMAVYASDAMTIDVTLTEVRRDRAFVPTELLDAPGTACELTLLPDGQAPLTIRGEVVSTRAVATGDGPAGIELAFRQMSEGTRLWIDLYNRRRTRVRS